MSNETNPLDVVTLAAKAIQALEDSQASPGDKAAALKTAAYAIEQAALSQQLAVHMSDLLNQQKGKK